MPIKKPRFTSERYLAFLNFFLADVAGGLGPYLAVFLISYKHWTASRIGVALSLTSISTLLVQTPVGIFVDETPHKRGILGVAIAAVTVASVCIAFHPSSLVVYSAQLITGIVGAVIGPAIAALTLGLVGPKKFTFQIGQNEAYNHAGNLTAAILIALASKYFGIYSVFYLLVIMAFLAWGCLLGIEGRKINHDVARGFDLDQPKILTHFLDVLKQPLVLIFALCVFVFHFANAPMLPLLGQRLTLINRGLGTVFMSACIIIAQLVMIPMAILVGKKADQWGRKPIFLVAFACLPLRGILYARFNNPYLLISVQALDGVGAGIFGALFPVVVVDLTRGTGRFNATLATIATLQGIGVSMSNLISGFIVDWMGYNRGFLFLSCIALAGFLLYLLGMPETLNLKLNP